MRAMLLLSSLVPLGIAAVLRSRRRSHRAAPVRPEAVPANDGEDLLPYTEAGDENGLAAFYAYQMAASKTKRA